jgi:TRAP-type C4-dicarboxylate transport system permease small subunit
MTPAREETSLVDVAEKLLDGIDWCLSRIAAVTVLATMVMIVCDVFGRYVFGKPLPWVYDVVSIYVINLVLYFMASEVLRTQSHIELDLKVRLLPPPLWGFLQVLGWLAVGVVLALAAWVAFESMAESFAKGEVHPGLYEWPVWVEKAVVGTGLSLLVLRIAVRCSRFVATGFNPAVFNADRSHKIDEPV